MGAGIVLCTVVVAVSHVLPHVFSPDAAVRDRAAVALVLVGTVQLPAAVVFVLDGVLIGASDTAYQQWANVAAFVVFCPFAAAVLRWHGFGIAGVWVGLLAWMVARLVANVARFAGPRWTMVAP